MSWIDSCIVLCSHRSLHSPLTSTSMSFPYSLLPVFTCLKFLHSPPSHTNFAIFNSHHPSELDSNVTSFQSQPILEPSPWSGIGSPPKASYSPESYCSLRVLIVILIIISNYTFFGFLFLKIIDYELLEGISSDSNTMPAT